ncbi:unnamed protein product, partial [Prorocentrum cordatum]
FNSSDDARLDTLHSSGLLDIGAGMDLDEALDGLEIPAGFIGDADAAPPVAEDPAGFIGDVADAAPPVAEEMQVDGLDQFGELDAAALVPKRKFEKNSALHIANAREALYRKRAKTSSQKLKAPDFQLAVKAVFLRAKQRVNIGVDHRRLQLAATRYVLRRQMRAVQHCLRKSSASLSNGGGPQRTVHVAVGHMWDEVEVKQSWKPSERYRTLRKNMSMPTLIQRSTMNLTLYDHAHDQHRQYQEYFLTQPLEVHGTTARDLLPGVRRGVPAAFDILNRPALYEALASVSSLTFAPMCDRASANVVMIRTWGHEAENKIYLENPVLGKKLLYFPDTCGVHAHHRGKLKIKGLRSHTMRHYSISSVFRLRGQLSKNIAQIERLIEAKLVREVGPPPPWAHTMERVVDLLYDLEADHHKRTTSNGGQYESQLVADLRELAKMANGSLSNKAFVHHCWDCATGRACCTSRKQADIDDTTAANVSVDEEGAQEFWSHLNRVRRKKVKEYYESDRVMNELVIYTSVLEATDSNLLYPVLGDAMRDAEGDKSKMDVLLDKDSSRIGAFSENMLRLIDNWNSGDPTRGHWVLLDILGAPLTNQEFAKWSRGQALKMNSIMSRRYEVRFATWPYKLYALSHGRSTEEEKNAIAREALAVNNYMVDCYTIGIRRLWPTPEDAPVDAEQQLVVAEPGIFHANFVEPISEQRPNPMLPPHALTQGDDSSAKSKKGLNPYLLEKNKYLQAARSAKGASLTAEEVEQHSAAFKQIWMESDLDVYAEAYQLWRQRRDNDERPPAPPKYSLCWGGGCHGAPVTPEEMCAEIEEFGWPTLNDMLDKNLEERSVPPTADLDVNESAGYDPWGVARSARNADRAASRCPAAFYFVEKSVWNYLASVGAGRGTSDPADVMIVIAGPAVGGGHKRYAVLVTDVTLNPQVFDVTINDFEDCAN